MLNHDTHHHHSVLMILLFTTCWLISTVSAHSATPLLKLQYEIHPERDQQSLNKYSLVMVETNTNITHPSSSTPNPYLQYVSIIPIALMGVIGFLICSLSLLSVIVYCAKEYRKRNLQADSNINSIYDQHHHRSSNFTSLSKNLVNTDHAATEDEENRIDSEPYTRRPQRLNRDYDSDEEQTR